MQRAVGKENGASVQRFCQRLEEQVNCFFLIACHALSSNQTVIAWRQCDASFRVGLLGSFYDNRSGRDKERDGYDAVVFFTWPIATAASRHVRMSTFKWHAEVHRGIATCETLCRMCIGPGAAGKPNALVINHELAVSEVQFWC